MITVYKTEQLIEKAKLKPWIVVEEDGELWYECPNCHRGKLLFFFREKPGEEFKYKYCPWCGQHTAGH